MRVKIIPSAIADLALGAAFYEKQQAGLGDCFMDSLFADIDSLAHHAGIHRKIFGSHQLLAKNFPFAVYYSIEDDVVRVKAVLDCRRDPHWMEIKLS